MKKIILSVSIILILPISLNAETFTWKASDFCLNDLEGNQIRLSDFKGKPLILFFWTTWCPYCRKGLIDLNNRYSELKADGIESLAVNIEETREKIKRFLAYYPVKFKVLLDIDASVADAYGLIGVPTYILIDKEGKVKFKNNYFPLKEYKKLSAGY